MEENRTDLKLYAASTREAGTQGTAGESKRSNPGLNASHAAVV